MVKDDNKIKTLKGKNSIEKKETIEKTTKKRVKKNEKKSEKRKALKLNLPKYYKEEEKVIDNLSSIFSAHDLMLFYGEDKSNGNYLFKVFCTKILESPYLSLMNGEMIEFIGYKEEMDLSTILLDMNEKIKKIIKKKSEEKSIKTVLFVIPFIANLISKSYLTNYIQEESENIGIDVLKKFNIGINELKKLHKIEIKVIGYIEDTDKQKFPSINFYNIPQYNYFFDSTKHTDKDFFNKLLEENFHYITDVFKTEESPNYIDFKYNDYFFSEIYKQSLNINYPPLKLLKGIINDVMINSIYKGISIEKEIIEVKKEKDEKCNIYILEQLKKNNLYNKMTKEEENNIIEGYIKNFIKKNKKVYDKKISEIQNKYEITNSYCFTEKDVETYIKKSFHKNKKVQEIISIKNPYFTKKDFFKNIEEHYFLDNCRKEVLEKIFNEIKVNKLFKNPTLGNSLLLGPTGTGKTEMAKAVSKGLFGKENFIEINVNQMKSAHHIDTIFGSPPGYVGYDKPVFGEKLEKYKEGCVILFDEIEKGVDDLYDAIMNIIDTGKIELRNGAIYDISNCFIFFTSNYIKDYNNKKIGFDVSFNTEKEKKEQSLYEIKDKLLDGLFKPEFLARIQDISILEEWTKNDLYGIFDFFIKKFEKQFNTKIKLKKESKDKIIEKTLKNKENIRFLLKEIKKILIEKELIK